MKIDSVKIRRISLIESSPDDQLQPKMHTFDYPKPGDLLPFRTPVIFDIASAHRFIADTTLLNSQFEVRGFSWSDDCRSLFFEYNQRGHQVYRVLSMKYIGHTLFNDERYGGNVILRGVSTAYYKLFVKNCFLTCPRQALHGNCLLCP